MGIGATNHCQSFASEHIGRVLNPSGLVVEARRPLDRRKLFFLRIGMELMPALSTWQWMWWNWLGGASQ